MEPYTVALTSCGRFDLLERTLRSLLPRLDGPVAKIIIAEDSGDRGVYDVVQQFSDAGPTLEVLFNDPRLGQIRSIDRLYSHIETDWIFHCEDDWEFFAEGFVGKSFALLKEFDRFSMVALRDTAEFPSHYYLPEEIASCGIRYREVNVAVAGNHAGLHLNPGLRRMRDYRLVGPYAAIGMKAAGGKVAKLHRHLGFRVANLVEPAVRHIGDGRHVPNPVYDYAAIPTDIGHFLRYRLEEIRWFLQPSTDPLRRARRRMEKAGLTDFLQYERRRFR
ncbi:MAG: glycosyltransferase family A protein [Rhodospirillaceae bacterium]|nr:glycosyltransferase family A protein [Rhodospirillaceae bacterium]MCY4066136.1 glycosyltransferase family A protein [Rhodospirillaceae bacterium]